METKSVLASKTIWGALAMLLAFILQQLKLDVSLESIDAVLGQVAQVIELISGIGGFVLAVYGRWKASHPVSLTGK